MLRPIITGTRAALIAIACVLLFACGDGSTRVCFSTGDDFCDDAFAANRSPEADAGSNQAVTGGARVTLDGSGSLDPDGAIASYSWSQQSGPSVALSQATGSQAAFDAPQVTQPASLMFRLTVTDDDGASDSDSVTISVAPAAPAALVHGVTWLDANPPPPCREDAPPACRADLGLWLGARVRAAEALQVPDATALLDLLRVMEITHVTNPGSDAARQTPAQRLFILGQGEVARFTANRDPATAERARQTAPGSPPRAADWHQVLADPAARTFLRRSTVAHAVLLETLRPGASVRRREHD